MRGIVTLVAVVGGVWLFTRVAQAFPPEAIPTVEPPSDAEPTIRITYERQPLRYESVSGVISQVVESYPGAATVSVVTPTESFNVDVPSTTQAAQISGMSYTDWLNLYAWGIGAVSRSLGRRLVGNPDGTGVWL